MTKNVKDLYNPIKSFFSKINLLEGLYLIWSYSRNYTFNEPMPENIQTRGEFIEADELWIRRMKGINEFELEFMLKELVIHSKNIPSPKQFLTTQVQGEIIDYIRGVLDDELFKLNPTGNILIDFNRMFQRQFKWQIRYSRDAMVRYSIIFSNPELKDLLIENVGIDIEDIHMIGFYLFGVTRNNFQIPYPFKGDGKIFTQVKVDAFFREFADNIENLREECQSHQKLDHTLLYNYNPLIAKPLLIIDNYFIVPLHENLFRRITEGVYYAIVGKTGFSNAFGKAFEDYVGLVLNNNILNPIFSVIPEFQFGKENKKSVDWCLDCSDSIALFECKTKRMTLKSKSETELEKGLNGDIDSIANAIVQLYQQCNYLKNGCYSAKIKYDSKKQILPVLLTLEPWFIELNPEINRLLVERLHDKMTQKKMNLDLLTDHPYMIIDCSRFEGDIQIINTVGIPSYVHMLRNNGYQDFLKDFDFSEPIEGGYERLFTEKIRNLKNSA